MKTAQFHFHSELNDFLAPERRNIPLDHHFELSSSLKDMIESLGVPHPEIGSVRRNSEPSGIEAPVRDGDRIDVYPHGHGEHASLSDLGAPVEIRFIADVHLGRLATYLRMLGFDTLYRNDYEDETLAHLSSTEQRILLTMDRGVLKRSIVTFGYFVRAHQPREQLVEVLRRYRLFDQVREFSRCLECNSLIHAVRKEDIASGLPQRTNAYFHDFRQCPNCRRVYWKGSHYEHMARFIQATKSAR